MSLIDQITYNVSPGPLYETERGLPSAPPADPKVRLIAYYLPQFHRIAENDLWWGPGFTEWTNVTKAIPRYRGHYQPRLPADLGFYDLSNVGTIEAQVALAKRAGIHGFCIHDYWFGGKKLLQTPLELIISNPQIDIPFCINWANENWTRRWDGAEHEILMAQNHSPQDDIDYARSLLPAMRDRRYIRINGRPLLMLYRPGILPDASATVRRWRKFFQEEGCGDPFVVMPQTFGDQDPRLFGMDAACGFPPHKVGLVHNRASNLPWFGPHFSGEAKSYAEMMQTEIASRDDDYRYFPGVCPSWDNEARKPNRGYGFYGSTPDLYASWLNNAAEFALARGTPDEALVFINAWNEWGEGAYLEPDRHYGYAYLAATRRALDSVDGGQPLGPAGTREPGRYAHHSLNPSKINKLRNIISRRLNYWGA